MKPLIIFSIPKFSFLAFFFKKPLVLLATVPAVVVTKVVDFKSMAIILFCMFIADLITGLTASYYIWKKSVHREKWFFGKGEGFSSDKFKKMFFKAMVYLSLPLLLIHFQRVLMLKNLKYGPISDAEFDLATIAIIVFCLTEGFSIFHENLPRCGFNLWHQIKKMIGFYKEFKSEISDNK